MNRLAATLVGVLGLSITAWAQSGPATQAESGPAGGDQSFEAIWLAASQAAAAGDSQRSAELLQTLGRLRIERNVGGLGSVALASVARGLDALEQGELGQAASEFSLAVDLDPRLAEAYFGLALTHFRRGPLHYFSGLTHVLSGLTAPLSSGDGQAHAVALLGVVAFATVLALSVVFGLCMVLRYGALVRHDIEELLGSETRRPLALGLYAVVLLLPVIALQGFAWLPFWWIALLFLHMRATERAVALILLVGLLAVGPLCGLAQARLDSWRNPLFRASLVAIEGSGDARVTAELERAGRESPDDLDLSYLLAAHYKKAGRYDSASEVYRRILTDNPEDALALNNLGNLDFAAADYAAAMVRYRAGLDSAEHSRVRATLYYNLHLAHLQRFEYQQAQDARSQADRLERGLLQDYERLWRVERDGSSIPAVVDLGLTPQECLVKFAGAPRGVRLKNVAFREAPGVDAMGLLRSAAGRFSGAVALIVVIIVVRAQLRGGKAFTLRCLKCGTPFCRKCHLGAAIGGLCTQCYHLFVVRDGVSGPARNQKLLEVQVEDERRERVFRILSLASPGAGHMYAQKTFSGVVLTTIWYALLSATLVGLVLLPVTQAPMRLVGPWPLAGAVLALLIVYLVANRARPDFAVVVPVRRGGPHSRVR
jgi:tetratricopeptide (TPR) repeat protein